MGADEDHDRPVAQQVPSESTERGGVCISQDGGLEMVSFASANSDTTWNGYSLGRETPLLRICFGREQHQPMA